MAKFEDYSLDPAILQALQEMNFQDPSPVQGEAIPLIQRGQDVIALAPTGSGKTAACAIPVCDRIDIRNNNIQALIVVPTRELALQYAVETQKIGKHKGVATFAIYGGADAGVQEAKLNHVVHVCVATPGRLIDFIHSRLIDLQHVETLILDEADKMLSMGFYEDLEFIMHCLVHEHQTLLFSATMPRDIHRIAKTYMNDPLDVALTVERKSPSSIEHFFVYCRHHAKDHELERILAKESPKQAIIFCNSRFQTEATARFLQKHFKSVDCLHGGFLQTIRTTITSKFRQGKVRFLVATDVASRGLDFSGVTHVVMYDMPRDMDLYLHRSGRTGRFGEKGMSLTLVTERDFGSVRRIVKHMERELLWYGGKPPDNFHSRRGRSSGKPQEKGRGQRSAKPRRGPRKKRE